MRDFEWRDAKAAENLRDHGIAFDKAVKAFADPYAVDGSTSARLTAKSAATSWACARA